MSTQQLSEKEMLTDILNNEKHIINTYTSAISESSCQNLRQVLLTQFTQLTEDQYNVFKEMNTRGYYPTKDAQDADVEKAKQDAKTMSTEFQ